MSVRNQAMANRVADAIEALLAGIGMSQVAQWLTSPKAIQRGIAADVLNLPKPGLFLLTAGWGPNTQHTLIAGNLTSRAEARFTVLCVTDSPVTSREAEQELNNLAADVITAIELDYQLGGLLSTGWVHVSAYTPEVELSSDRFAVASVELNATWIWDTTSP